MYILPYPPTPTSKEKTLKKFALIISTLLLLSGSPAFAEKTCKNTKYTQPIGFITYGMDYKAVEAALRKNHPGFVLQKDTDKIVLVFPNSNRDTFDMHAFNFNNNKLVEIKISYSNKFQDSFGGPSNALVAVLKKFVEKYGKADKVNEIDKGYKAEWFSDGGLELSVIGKDPYTIIATFTCSELDGEIRDQKAKSTNFGI